MIVADRGCPGLIETLRSSPEQLFDTLHPTTPPEDMVSELWIPQSAISGATAGP